MLDRIAQIVLVIFGAILLALLVLGLAVSCRSTAADPISLTVTASINSPTPGGPASGTIVPLPPTPIIVGTLPTGPTATPTPSATATSGAGVVPEATLAPGATPGQPGAGGAGLVPGSTVPHTVSRGEWMLQIARCYGTPYQPFRVANTIVTNPDFILPGWVLTVPSIGSIGPITGPPCVVAYTVAAGDTWESLAQRHGTTAAILQRANPGSLTVGRSIWVPRAP